MSRNWESGETLLSLLWLQDQIMLHLCNSYGSHFIPDISTRKPKSSRRPPISWSSFSGPALLSPSTNIVKEITVDMMLRAKPAEDTLNGERGEYFIPTTYNYQQ